MVACGPRRSTLRPPAAFLALALPDRLQPLPRLPPPSAARARRSSPSHAGSGRARSRRTVRCCPRCPPSPRRAPRGAAERRRPALLSRPRRGRGGRDPRLPARHGEESAARRHGAPARAGPQGKRMTCEEALATLLLTGSLDPAAAAHVSACAHCRAEQPVVTRALAAYAAPEPRAILTARVLG